MLGSGGAAGSRGVVGWAKRWWRGEFRHNLMYSWHMFLSTGLGTGKQEALTSKHLK